MVGGVVSMILKLCGGDGGRGCWSVSVSVHVGSCGGGLVCVDAAWLVMCFFASCGCDVHVGPAICFFVSRDCGACSCGSMSDVCCCRWTYYSCYSFFFFFFFPPWFFLVYLLPPILLSSPYISSCPNRDVSTSAHDFSPRHAALASCQTHLRQSCSVSPSSYYPHPHRTHASPSSSTYLPRRPRLIAASSLVDPQFHHV